MARPDALSGVRFTPYWLDDPVRPSARSRLDRDLSTDLLVVGGGYTGLWTALLAKEAEPEREVTLVEAERIGWAASGRNGGFCAASLTHGAPNGLARFPEEYDTLERLGAENLSGLVDAVDRYGIDCHLERSGSLDVATEPHQVEWLQEEADRGEGEFLDTAAVRREVDSPTYLAGLWDRQGTVLVHPARLAWGLAQAAEHLGVRIYENTRVRDLSSRGRHADGATASGLTVARAGEHSVTARQVALGTNVFPSLVHRARPFVIPVYDYAVVTEPLTDAQMAVIGWAGRQGIGDVGNQFHYYRLTADNRILFGGYDAVYHLGKRVRPSYDVRRATFEMLIDHLDETFPQLGGVRIPTRGAEPSTCADASARSSARRIGGGRLLRRLHRPRRGRNALRRAGHARPVIGGGDGADRHPDGAHQADAVPAGTPCLVGSRHDEAIAAGCRPQRGQAKPLAADAGPARPRLRQLATSRPPRGSPSGGQGGEALRPTTKYPTPSGAPS